MPTVTEPTPTADATEVRNPAYFIQARPIWHHVVLMLGTFGLYAILWYYRVWRYFRVVPGREVIPILRALFDPIFIYSLLRHLSEEARRRGYPESPPSGALAVVYVALSFCRALPSPAWFAQFLLFVPLLPAFEMANFIWRKEWPGLPERTRFSLGETLVLALGVFMWTNLLYAAIFQPELLPQRPVFPPAP